MKILSSTIAGQLTLSLSALPLVLSQPVWADITDLTLFKTQEYNQTTNSPPSIPVDFFATARAFVGSITDFASASLTVPNSTTQAMGLVSDPVQPHWLVDSGLQGSKAAMDAAFPFGNYSVIAANSDASHQQTVSLNYSLDAYSSSVPALTVATYDALQHLSATQSHTINFNPFTPNPTTQEQFIFFDINDGATNVLHQAFANATTTSFVLPANTLQSGHAYTFDLVFSNRLVDSTPLDSNGLPYRTDIGFDLRTNGSLATAPVPVPAAAWLLGSAIGGLGVMRRRRV